MNIRCLVYIAVFFTSQALSVLENDIGMVSRIILTIDQKSQCVISLSIKISQNIGAFSNYTGLKGQKLSTIEYGHLAKQMLREYETKKSNEKNKLIISPDETAKNIFGQGEVRISVSKIHEMMDAARLYVHSSLITPAQFTQGTASGSEFNSIEIASGICHAQPVYFFVEQELEGSVGRNRIRKSSNQLSFVNLDSEQPVWLLSIPGISGWATLITNEAKAKRLLIMMWEAILYAAKSHFIRYLVIPPIGLGIFLPPNEGDKKKVAEWYVDTLSQVLDLPENKDYFCKVFFNVGRFAEQSKKFLVKKSLKNNPLVIFEKDAKFLAIELAKNNIPVALVNPANASVVRGSAEVGNTWRSTTDLAEQDFAGTSTAVIGSKSFKSADNKTDLGNNTVYTDLKKIISVPASQLSKKI